MTINLRSLGASLVLVVGFATCALAHDSDRGPNGGQIVESKGHHIEFTLQGTQITVYLSDEAHAAIPSTGATGRAVILDGTKQSTVVLAPAEPNVLTAKLDAALNTGARVVITAKLSDGHDILARFVKK